MKLLDNNYILGGLTLGIFVTYVLYKQPECLFRDKKTNTCTNLEKQTATC